MQLIESCCNFPLTLIEVEFFLSSVNILIIQLSLLIYLEKEKRYLFGLQETNIDHSRVCFFPFCLKILNGLD